MAKFNQSNKKNETTSYEGGIVYEKSLENEWSNMIFSSMLEDGYYESSEEYTNRYIELTKNMIALYGPDFIAKAATFVRNELGLRSISELTAALLNSAQFEGKRNFYKNYFHRPDGIGEVFAAVEMLGAKRSHALIRGCADYLETLDAYQVDKYNMRNREFNMYDIINITHANSEVINKYKNGTLEKADTWERATKNNIKTQEERSEQFIRLASEGKMGYIALLRNLNNIFKSNEIDLDWVEDCLVTQLIDRNKIKKSLVFPYQIYVAYKSAERVLPTCVKSALSEAFKVSVGNMKPIKGKNAIVLDVSGSMRNSWSKNSILSISEVCSVYAVALYLMKDCDFDIYKFGTEAKKCLYSKLTDPFSLIKRFSENAGIGHGTNFCTAINTFNERYDNVFLFSDMQICDQDTTYTKVYDRYKKEYDANPMLFSFDLGNYHTQVEPNNNRIKYITTISEKVFEIINFMDNENMSLIDYIKAYSDK